MAPPGGVTFSSRPSSGFFSRFPGPRGHPPLRPGAPLSGIPAPTGMAPGRGRSRRARGLRAPRAAPRGPAARPFPSAPPRLPLFGSLARSLRRPVGPAGTGGAEEGRGCVPPARGRGGDPGACCQRAGEGRTAALRRTRAPGGSALAETVGAGGGGRARQARKGREGRRERRSVRGGAPGPGGGARATGRGLQRGQSGQGGPAGPHRAESAARGLERPRATSLGVETQGGFRGGREVKPTRPYPGFPSWSGFVPFCPHLYVSLLLLSPRSL